MDFSKTDTKTLLKLWSNSKKGLTAVSDTLEKGTFHTPREKGAAPPSQSGQMILWIALAVDNELTKRGISH